jgi:hypothetical protein
MSTGTIGANRTPSILRFLTSTDASPSVLTERMIITEAGNIGIGNTTPLAKLQVTTTTNGNPTNTYKGIAIFDAGNGIGLSIGGSPSNNSMYLQSVLPISSGSNAYNLKLQPTGGKLAIFTESIDYDISIGGDAARILSLVRNTISNTAGSSLTLGSGGATSGATNKAAGNIILSTGTSTGSASADFQIFTPTPDGSGTTDRVPVKREDLFTRILADNGTVALASGRSGIGIITVGDGEEYAWFSFTTAGVVTLVTNSSNVTTTQGTNDKINIYDAGSNVTIENTFTASKVLTVKILYNL